jgi:hypothetical protein
LHLLAATPQRLAASLIEAAGVSLHRISAPRGAQGISSHSIIAPRGALESARHTSFSRSGFNEALPKPDKHLSAHPAIPRHNPLAKVMGFSVSFIAA